MISNLTLSEARDYARRYNGTYRKLGRMRYDDEKHQFVDEPNWVYMDWSEYYVWKNQK